MSFQRDLKLSSDAEGDMLPSYSHGNQHATPRQGVRRGAASSASRFRPAFVSLIGLITLIYYLGTFSTISPSEHRIYKPTSNPRLQELFEASLQRCEAIQASSGPPSNFYSRKRSERFESGTADLVIRNGTLWTGRDHGREILEGYDVLLSNGMIKDIRKTSAGDKFSIDESKIKVVDAKGKWVTPGLIDMHVHLSVGALPTLKGQDDVNSIGKNTNPYLRSIDGMNQHDVSFKKSIAGGITTGLVLPGSANSMGGQAFPIKYRQVRSHTPQDRVIEPPTSLARLGQGKDDAKELEAFQIETGLSRNDSSSSWRYMKMACGENARRIYKITRMDESWDFRRTLDSARTLKGKQDAFCAKAKAFAATHGAGAAPLSESDAEFPDDLEQEALVDLLRGKVKLNTHCYTQIDFEDFIRHSNEFQFPVAAFHHAHEAYLVPDLLKQTYGNNTPAIAIFSTNANYKLEAYFGSPFAGTILHQEGIEPIYKSDHPVTDSRRIVNQAAQAHHFGLPEHVAMRSVISAPAERLGLDHRLGFLKKGWDADVVIWNTHPLRMGATPVEVVIDGIRQLGDHAHVPSPQLPGEDDDLQQRASAASDAPASANFTAEIADVKKNFDGIIGLEKLAFPTAKEATQDCVVFTNVKHHFFRSSKVRGKVSSTSFASPTGGTVVVEGGKILCFESGPSCLQSCSSPRQIIDLKEGTLLPGLTSYGSNLGLTDIVSEGEASDGYTLDPITGSSSNAISETSKYLSQHWPVVRAVDGLQYQGHDLLRARASGVTSAIVFPQSDVFFSGVSVKFDTGAKTPLDDKAVKKEEVAAHITITHNDSGPSISEQFGLLRKLLTEAEENREVRNKSQPTIEKDHARRRTLDAHADVWERVVTGELPLLVTVLRADHIATLLKISDAFPSVRIVVSGGAESHLLASELASRNIGVLLIPQTWPRTFDELRGLAGPPLTAETTLSVLLEAGVKVALKIEEAWMASNLLWDATRAALETNGKVDKNKIVQLITTDLDDILGITDQEADGDHEFAEFVAYDGNPFEYGAKVVAIHSKAGTELVS